MASIIIDDFHYNYEAPDVYRLSTATFGGVQEWFRAVPNRPKQGKKALPASALGTPPPVSCSLTFSREQDFTVGQETERRTLFTSILIRVPQGFTPDDVHAHLLYNCEALSSQRINRLLLGGVVFD